MFHHFPDSAKMLGKDDGLFQGPRPGVFKSVEASVIRDLVQTKLNGVVVLTHDENIQEVKEKLGGYELVYGIRYSKGLEVCTRILLFKVINPDHLIKTNISFEIVQICDHYGFFLYDFR